jgi:uncharacterized membrane protein
MNESTVVLFELQSGSILMLPEDLIDSLTWIGVIVTSLIFLEVVWWIGLFALVKLNKYRKGVEEE